MLIWKRQQLPFRGDPASVCTPFLLVVIIKNHWNARSYMPNSTDCIKSHSELNKTSLNRFSQTVDLSGGGSVFVPTHLHLKYNLQQQIRLYIHDKFLWPCVPVRTGSAPWYWNPIMNSDLYCVTVHGGQMNEWFSGNSSLSKSDWVSDFIF